MKTLPFLSLLALPFLGMASGCGKAQSPTPTTSPSSPQEKSSMQTAVDGFTGKTAVDQGLKAKEQIKMIAEKEKRDREEAMQ